jgi:hypothetical protein
MVARKVRRNMRAAGLQRLAVVAIGLATAGVLMAQYRVNTQLNTGLYGAGAGSVRHANLPFYRASTPSGRTHARFLSGALPSEIRGQYLLKGPLAPSGALAYLPTTRRPYGSFRAPVLPRSLNTYNQPLSVPGAFAPRSPVGSLRYSSGRVPTAPWRSASGMPRGGLGYRAPSAFGRSPYGSMRYGP